MTAPPTLTPGPLATRYALTYQDRPRKAVAAITAARRHAQEARQAGEPGRAEEWEEVADVLTAILGNRSRCQICGRKIEDPLSVARGIGPDCWEKQR